MAFGALTLGTQAAAQASSTLFADFVSFAGDASYPTTGNTGLLAALQAATKDGRVIVGIIPQDCGGYVPVYDVASDKLKVYWCAGAGAAMTEVTNTTNLSAVTFKLLVLSQ